MTRITVSIEVKETVDPAKLGLWLEAWIRDQWDGHGEPSGIPGGCQNATCSGHAFLCFNLSAVKAQPPASGRKVPRPVSPRCPDCYSVGDCDCGRTLTP